jgi:hypothetical protein
MARRKQSHAGGRLLIVVLTLGMAFANLGQMPVALAQVAPPTTEPTTEPTTGPGSIEHRQIKNVIVVRRGGSHAVHRSGVACPLARLT